LRWDYRWECIIGCFSVDRRALGKPGRLLRLAAGVRRVDDRTPRADRTFAPISTVLGTHFHFKAIPGNRPPSSDYKSLAITWLAGVTDCWPKVESLTVEDLNGNELDTRINH
jgi:hypothetical protein